MTSHHPSSLFKAQEDLSDHEFDNIFNDVISQSSPTTKSSSLTKTMKKESVKTDKRSGQTIVNPKPIISNHSSHQALLVTCTSNVVTARNVQLLNGDDEYEDSTIVTAVGQPIIVAEELGETTAINLSSNGQWLALALSCFQVWIIQLTWKSVKQAASNTSATRLPKIINAVRHHATLEGHKALIHGLHFLKGDIKWRILS